MRSVRIRTAPDPRHTDCSARTCSSSASTHAANIAVTSAVPGEGKTTTALNLSAALAEAGYNVCLVEADLRRPNIAVTLGLAPDVGFTTALIGKSTSMSHSECRSQTVRVDLRPVPPNPSELLITVQARNCSVISRRQFDYVIIDCAPLLPVAEARRCRPRRRDIARPHAGKTTFDHAARALDTLTQGGERPSASC